MKPSHVIYFSVGQIMLLVIALSVLSRGQRQRLDDIKGEVVKTREEARLTSKVTTYVAERLELLSPIKAEQFAVRSDIRELNTKLGALSPIISITNQIPPPAYAADQVNLLLPYPGDFPQDSPPITPPPTKPKK